MTDQEAAAERDVMHEAVPRNFRIEAKDFEAHGYSAKCPGCSSVLKRTARQAHTDACRKLFGELMKDDDKTKKHKEKIDEFVAKAVEKSDLERVMKRERPPEGQTDGLAESRRATIQWRCQHLADRDWQKDQGMTMMTMRKNVAK